MSTQSLTNDPAPGVVAAHGAGLRPVGIIAVNLYGHSAEHEALNAAASIVAREKLWVMADAAQSFGPSVKDSCVGTLANIRTTSFFPSKSLGCYGDGGAVFTDNAETVSMLRSLRLHGRGEKNYYDNVTNHSLE